jgi:hypothetical protein
MKPDVPRARLNCFGLLILAFSASATVSVAGADQAPKLRYSGQDVARWLPLSEAVVEGEPQPQLLSPEDRSALEGWLADRPPATTDTTGVPSDSSRRLDTCDVEIVTSAGPLDPNADKALAEASTALFGTIQAIETGLFHGRLATLVTVDVERWLKWQLDGPPPSRIRFIDTSARARIDGRTYCFGDAERREALVIGSRVFTATNNLLETEPLALFPYANQLYFETAANEVWPRAQSSSWGQFEQRLSQQGMP